MSDNSNVTHLEMVPFISKRKLDQSSSWQAARFSKPFRHGGFIYPVSERTEVSSPDWWSHVSFDRPSSTTLHTITRFHQPPRPAEVSMSPKQMTGQEMYLSLERRIHHFWWFFICNIKQISTETSWWMWCEDNSFQKSKLFLNTS